MKRRNFLKAGLITTGVISAGSWFVWKKYFDGPLVNSCLINLMPKHLVEHEYMQQALSGLSLNNLWDCHFHLIGNGLQPSLNKQMSGIWLNPALSSWRSPKQKIQYEFYLRAGCIKNEAFGDSEYVNNLITMLKTSPPNVRYMLLAFDYHHNDDGSINKNNSTFYVPNKYAALVASSHPQFEWIASVHPYREDAIEQLEWCAANGARAIKWLPPAMNIDPASKKCDAFYNKLVALGLPLLTHAGEEKAVHGEEFQALANPLLLRRPLELGVKVIVAHCASLGESEDIESQSKKRVSNFELFSRLMNEQQYDPNLLADISAMNFVNRKVKDIQQLLLTEKWHSRLLYASDFPLPGVIPLISSKKLVDNHLLDKKFVPFLSEVRKHNTWLFDLLQKRFLEFQGVRFSDQVFSTKHHFFVDNP